MKLPGLNKYRTVIFHFLFWVLIWFFFSYFFSYNSENTAYVIWFSSFLLPLTIAATYFMVYRLIPGYLLKKDYRRFALYSFYLFVITSYIIALIIYGCLIFILNMNIDRMPPMSKNFMFILILVFMVVGAVSSVTILNYNFRISSKNKELENKILATQLELKEQELQYLKNQIHPHFLFNTLNTIYGMAIAQSKQTPDLILRLSNLLDYILYQVNKPRVRLKDEVGHIKEYIELEKVRFEDSLEVKMNIDNIDDHTEIAPMLLIPMVENAFKHGTLKEGFLRIEIDISARDDRLNFYLRNSFANTGNLKKGIGLENIRKRLELHYPENYILEINTDEEFFNVRLEITDLLKISNA